MFLWFKGRINTGSTLICAIIVLRNIFKELFYGICVKVGNNWGSQMCTYTVYSYIKDCYREYSYTSFHTTLIKLNSFKELIFKEFKELVSVLLSYKLLLDIH